MLILYKYLTIFINSLKNQRMVKLKRMMLNIENSQKEKDELDEIQCELDKEMAKWKEEKGEWNREVQECEEECQFDKELRKSLKKLYELKNKKCKSQKRI